MENKTKIIKREDGEIFDIELASVSVSKKPLIFQEAKLVIINKIDLAQAM